jgi:hypothetical protein
MKRQIIQIKNNIPRGESSLKAGTVKKVTKDTTTLPTLNKGLSRSASGPVIRGKLVRGNNFDG